MYGLDTMTELERQTFRLWQKEYFAQCTKEAQERLAKDES